MSYLKSWGSKFDKGLSHVVEAIFSGVFSIAAFGALFWFDEWWKSITTAVRIFFAGFLVSLAIGRLRGEK
ncbi:hypothetical protein [Serratia sp. NA_13]|uniref:hypothetical protein n=1 Tax=Serratia sp. NA_13 TaxID=3415658 RepID=UPI004046CAFB